MGKSKAELIGLKASKYGNKIHEYCQKLCDGDRIRVSKKYKKVVNGLKAWIADNIEETIGTEEFVLSETYSIGGTLDWVGKVKGYDGLSIIDWKSGRIKKEHYLQLAAYRKLLKEYKGLEISHRLIGDIKKPNDKRKKTIILRELKEDSIEIMEKDWNIYLDYLEIWYWMQGKYYKRPCTRVEELEKEIERHKKYIKFITEKYNEEF